MRRGGVAALVAASLSVGLGTAVTAGAAGASATPNAASNSVAAIKARFRDAAARMEHSVRARAVMPHVFPTPSMQVHDASGDVPLPEADLTGVGLAQNSSGTSFGVKLVTTPDPAVDANWSTGLADVWWFVDTNNDQDPDVIAWLFYDFIGGQLVALVGDGSGPNLSCNPSGVYVAGSGFRVNAPAGCVPHLTTVRMLGLTDYGDPTVDPSAESDSAPDLDFSGPVVINQVVQTVHTGYWMLGSDGRVYPFGGAVGFPGTVPFATGMAPRKDGKGYWVVDGAGHVFAYGTTNFGGSPPLASVEIVSTISATPSNKGYWLFTNRGRAFPFGDAISYGDMSGVPLNGPIVASVATPSGHGYYMVGSDGGIFSFGDARFHGSTGNIRLNKPVVGIAPTPDNKGYWLVASDGGVFAFNAPFRGSMGGVPLNQAVDGLVAYGNGYLMAAADGGIFDFSNRVFAGSLPSQGRVPSAPIIGLAAFSVTTTT